MMIVLYWLAVIVAAIIFSHWSWNRCVAIGGNADNEPELFDIAFALAVALAIWGCRGIFA